MAAITEAPTITKTRDPLADVSRVPIVVTTTYGEEVIPDPADPRRSIRRTFSIGPRVEILTPAA